MKRVWLFLLGIVVLAFVVRFYRVTESPAGLYIDETSIGYNAWSLLNTGRDEHGQNWPLFLEAFGEYKLPVYVYSVVLAETVLGPIDLAVRLPAVLFGTGSVLLVFFLARELFGKRASIGLFASFLLAISPWHFQFTHAGFEASSGIFFLLLGLVGFLKSVHNKSLSWLMVSCISFVLTLYAYNSARIVVPLLVFLLFILYIRRFSWKYWLGVGIFGIILLLPFIQFVRSPAGWARAQQVSIFYQSTPQTWINEFTKNYWTNISPETLFITGEPTIAHLTPHRMSLMYIVELPFFLLGLLLIVRKGRREYWFVLLWFLIGLIPPALTTLNPHALRASFTIPAAELISMLGFILVLDWLHHAHLRFIGRLACIAMLILSLVQFLSIYHGSYAVDAGWDWQVDIRRAATLVTSISQNYDRIYIDESGPGRISYAWYLGIPPRLFQKIQETSTIGKYQFNASDFEAIPEFEKSLYVTRQRLTEEEIVAVIYYPNGNEAMWLYEF